jgi:membrane protein DedA with SNARE-associated domain
MIGSVFLSGMTDVVQNFLILVIIIGAALVLIPVIGYLGTWVFGGKQMKKEWSSFNEQEKKQEQLNVLKYMMPVIIVAAVIFVFISSTIFMGNTLK